MKTETTGTKIANKILDIYKERDLVSYVLSQKKLDFKNAQRRVYDALNVFSALGIINKDRNRITYRGL